MICLWKVNREGIVFVRNSRVLPPLGNSMKKCGSYGYGLRLTGFLPETSFGL